MCFLRTKIIGGNFSEQKIEPGVIGFSMFLVQHRNESPASVLFCHTDLSHAIIIMQNQRLISLYNRFKMPAHLIQVGMETPRFLRSGERVGYNFLFFLDGNGW